MEKDDLLGAISSALSVLGIVALALSVSFDFSFLYAIGLSFSEVPTTLGDHVRSSIIWIPISLFVLAFVFLISALTSPFSTIRIFFGKKETSEEPQEKNEQQETPVTTRSRFKTFEAIVFTTFPIIVFFIDFSGGRITAILVPIFTLSWLLKARKKDQRIKRLVVFLIVLTGCIGYERGLAFITAPIMWDVQYASTNEGQLKKIRSIRRFSDFSIINDEDKQVSVIPNSEIKSVQRIEKPGLRESYTCQWFGVVCRRFNEGTIENSD